MMKTFRNTHLIFGSLVWIILGCSEQALDSTETEFIQPSSLVAKAQEMMNLGPGPTEVQDFIQLSLKPVDLSFDIPDLQSAAFATYHDEWVLIGGRKSGLHSMSSDPIAFQKLTANDSIWVINLENQTSVGYPIPDDYKRYLSAGSMLHYQDGDILHISGGFTYSDTTYSDWTSDKYFELNIPNLINYVLTAGTATTFDEVIVKETSDPFLKVTGGEMVVSNGNIYLAGGQNYEGFYSSGNNGTYTSALRKFNVTGSPGNWIVSGKDSIVDSVRLHRRDYTLAEVLTSGSDSIGAVILGGVFNKYGLGYPSPVYLNSLGSGQPTATLEEKSLQFFNLYSAAKVESVLTFGDSKINRISILGGITYKAYNPDSGGVYQPHFSLRLPFSNVISTYYTDGDSSIVELIQMPPNEMMPGYLGSNAAFMRLSKFLYGDSNTILDLNKVFAGNETGPVLVGYMYGGIDSDGPYTKYKGMIVNTRPSQTLYAVYMNIVN
ncbi:hypothetical protein ACFOSV_06405 [Algoriphagus namhaensis]|uniref:PKD-like family protein n=1 Tax=Algoriphagus namhaensis TaxID=915353 RepID=A0ABV8APB0_9BACT